MKRQELFSKQIGVGYGFGFVGALTMIGLMTSLFILWALSCLGGAACDLITRII